jgi:hypothetical protein
VWSCQPNPGIALTRTATGITTIIMATATGAEFARHGPVSCSNVVMRPQTMKWVLVLVLSTFGGASLAQTSGAPSPEKGTAADGSRPAEGAIKGGSILPGETAGMPNPEAKSRCADLTGTLKEQCLEQEQGAAAGGTRLPEPGVAKPPPTREAPPPQNPR